MSLDIPSPTVSPTPAAEAWSPTATPRTSTAEEATANRAAGSRVEAKGRRANALRHGLTANKLLPAILQGTRLSEIKARLRDEFRPRTFAEELVLQEAARHFALLEVVEQAEPAVLRQSAQVLASVIDSSANSDDLQLAAAVTAEPLDRVARYRRSHEKGLFRAIEWLQRSKLDLPSRPAAQHQDFAECFSTEQACEEYLLRFFTSTGWACARCKSTSGHWLPSRNRWECGDCRTQAGLRTGTVFEGSRLPLTTWFRTIRGYLANTSMTVRELADLAGINRLATARSMLQRLQKTINAEGATLKFAGLCAFPLPPDSHSIAPVSILRNEMRGLT